MEKEINKDLRKLMGEIPGYKEAWAAVQLKNHLQEMMNFLWRSGFFHLPAKPQPAPIIIQD